MSTNAEALARDVQLLEGIRTVLGTHTFMIGGKVLTAAEVMAVLDGRVAAGRAVVRAKAAFHQAVLERDDELDRTEPYVQGVRSTVRVMYSGLPEDLVHFGVTMRKPRRPLTVAENVLAVARRKATREARHTLGPVARLQIKGELTGPILVPLDRAAGADEVASAEAGDPSGDPAAPRAKPPPLHLSL